MAVSSGSAGLREQRSRSKRASRLAEKQFGAISRRQLREIGFSEERIRGWLHSERLHIRHPGVYALGRRELGTEGEMAAALLHAGRGAALAGLTALWWMGLLGHRPDRIHIDAPGDKRSGRGVAIRHPREIHRATVGGLPTVPLPTALLRAAGDLSHDSLRLVLARADFRKILSLPELHTALGKGRPGSRAVHAALAAHLPQLARCSNRFERVFVLLCERFSLPIPDPNVRIGRYRPDMLWREARLIVELDGGDAHSSDAQLQADASRQAFLEALGYVVLRFTWADVHSAPERVASEVRSAMICACASPSPPMRGPGTSSP